MKRPHVSVIIPTYNRAALLDRALESVIQQTYRDWEIVLVDDGSTDDTPSVVAPYARSLGDRLKYVRQPNCGASAARNHGIDIARGRFIAFLDSDDAFAPTKLARQLELFGRRPELGLVFSDYLCVDHTAETRVSAFDEYLPAARSIRRTDLGDRLHVCHDDLFSALLRNYLIATIVGLVRRDVLTDQVRFAERISYAEEWLFYLQVTRRCRAGFVDEPLSVHHFVTGSLARTDRRRNVVGLVNLFETIQRAFPDLNSAQRETVRTRLAHSYRQRAFDQSRNGDAGPALADHLRAAWLEPTPDYWRSVCGAAWAGLRQSVLRLAPKGDQATHPVVR